MGPPAVPALCRARIPPRLRCLRPRPVEPSALGYPPDLDPGDGGGVRAAGVGRADRAGRRLVVRAVGADPGRRYVRRAGDPGDHRQPGGHHRDRHPARADRVHRGPGRDRLGRDRPAGQRADPRPEKPTLHRGVRGARRFRHRDAGTPCRAADFADVRDAPGVRGRQHVDDCGRAGFSGLLRGRRLLDRGHRLLHARHQRDAGVGADARQFVADLQAVGHSCHGHGDLPGCARLQPGR